VYRVRPGDVKCANLGASVSTNRNIHNQESNEFPSPNVIKGLFGLLCLVITSDILRQKEHSTGFSGIVKQVRQFLKISQEELAHALNVSYVTINRWENGRSEPNRIAKAVFYAFCEKKGVIIQEEINGK
jgi:DNA-binding XRE family transcriptional regulator